MDLLHSPDQYLYNLYTTSSSEAKRIWRKQILEKWDHKCAYCGSDKNLTIDHIIPQSKGGMDFSKNVVSCCNSCNQNKGHTYWEDWYCLQEFFSLEKYEKIKTWMKPDPPKNLFSYKPRRNIVS